VTHPRAAHEVVGPPRRARRPRCRGMNVALAPAQHRDGREAVQARAVDHTALVPQVALSGPPRARRARSSPVGSRWPTRRRLRISPLPRSSWRRETAGTRVRLGAFRRNPVVHPGARGPRRRRCPAGVAA
jgi:hypothetical protein